jgi:hypothetical protein
LPEVLRTILFVPQEPATLFWERDLGIRRDDVVACENANAPAEWFDLCKNLMSVSPTFVNLTVGDAQAAFDQAQRGLPPAQRPSPVVILTTSSQRVRLVFKPAFPIRAAATAESLPTPSVIRTGEDGLLKCGLSGSLPAGISAVRVEWRASRKGGPTSTLHEDEDLPPRIAEGTTDLRCRVTLFDGTAFLPRETSVHPALYAGAARVETSPVTITPDSLFRFDAATYVGRLRSGEAFSCHSLWPSKLERDPCLAFDPDTGRFSTRLLTDAAARGSDGPVVSQVELSRREGEGIVQRNTVLMTVDAGPSTKTPSLAVSLVRDALSEHLECSGPGGAPLLEPVTWRVGGSDVPGWQQNYLPAFLLRAGAAYSCHARASSSDSFAYEEYDTSFRAPREIRFPQGAEGITFDVVVPPFPQGGLSLECIVDGPPLCERVADAGELTGKVVFRLKRGVGAPPPLVRLVLTTPQGRHERTSPVVAAPGPREESKGDSPRQQDIRIVELAPSEIPLTYASGNWRCPSPTPGRALTRIEGIHWYLGSSEVVAARGRVDFAQPVVEEPTSLVCVLVEARLDSAQRTVSFGQSMLMPAGPRFDGEEEGSDLVLLGNEPAVVTLTGTHQGAPLARPSCVVAIDSTAKSWSVPCDARQSPTGRFDLSATLPISAVLDMRRRLLAIPPTGDAFEPIEARLRVNFPTARYAFERERPLSLVMPNHKPSSRVFTHYTDATGRTACAALLDDPEENHLSLAISSHYDASLRVRFDTRERDEALATLAPILESEDRARLGARLGGIVTFAEAGGGERDQGCEMLASDGTSLVVAKSKASTMQETRALFARVIDETPPSVELATQPQSVGTSPSLQASGRTKDDRPSVDSDKETPPDASKPALPSVGAMRVKVVAPGRYTLGPAFALSTPPQPDNSTESSLRSLERQRIVACDGPTALCAALYLHGGMVNVVVTSTVPDGVAMLEVRGGNETRVLVVDLQSAVYAPVLTDEATDCADLLARGAASSLPSYLRVATYARVPSDVDLEPGEGRGREGVSGRGFFDRALPTTRVAAALGAGADDIICEMTLQWGGQALAIRTASLRESLLATRTGRRGRLLSPLLALPPAAPLPAPRDGRISLPSLVFVRESQTRDVVLSPLATRWRVARCRVETLRGSEDCRFDPSTLLVYGLPREGGFTLDFAVEQRVAGSSRVVRLTQAFEASRAARQTLLPAAHLRREPGPSGALICTLSGEFPAGTLFTMEFRLGEVLVERTTSSAPSRTFIPRDPVLSTAVNASCHVEWPDGADQAFLSAGETPSVLESVCLIDADDVEGVRSLPCLWPQSVALRDGPLQEAQSLRRALESTSALPRRSWVKWILSARDTSWRQSYFLPPATADLPTKGSTDGAPGTRRVTFLPPWGTAGALCLARNGTGATDVYAASDAADADNPGGLAPLDGRRSRKETPCGFLHGRPPIRGVSLGADGLRVSNVSALGSAAPSPPPPFVASTRQAASRALAAAESFFANAPPEKGTCVFRCRWVGDSQLLEACRAAVLRLRDSSRAPGRCEVGTDTPAREAFADAAILEVELKTRDTSTTPLVHPLGIIVP